jgi:uncharacterized Zn finger protein
LEERTRNVEVTVRGTVTVPFSVTVTVSRSAGEDDDDVEERASTIVNDDYSARDLGRDYADYYDAEFEVDEAEIQ